MHALLSAHVAEVTPIVADVICELFWSRRDVLADYIATRGRTDWVWLEETLSLYLSERLPTAGDAVENRRYLAAFSLALAEIRSRHPEIDGPKWLPVATRALALEAEAALVALGHDERDVMAFIQDAAGMCDDDDGLRGAAGENVYTDIHDVIEDFHNWRARAAANPDSPYCKPRHVFMRRAAVADLIERGHDPAFVEAFERGHDDAYFDTATYDSVANDFAMWKRR